MGVLVGLLFHEGLYGILEIERERESERGVYICVTAMVVGFE